MTHRFKKLSRLKGKKRYIVLGLLAVELMSLPAAAAIVHKAAFDVKPTVTAVEIPTAEPGFSRFIVTSTAGFDVKADDVAGDISVNVHVSGTLGSTKHFGEAAQLPGPKTICAQTTGPNAAIYKADRTTAAREAATTERAVVFEFRYDPDARPDFKFVADQDKKANLIACIKPNS